MADLGKAYVQIVPSAEGISGKIKGVLEPEAQAAGEESGKGYSSMFGSMLAANLAGSAITGAFQKIAQTAVDTVKQAVSNYASYEQLIGGVETLFKESAGIVEEYADNAYRTAGLSANEYMETVTSFSASLLQSLGGDTEAAAKLADQAITDMADNANKMGSSMESIQNAYQGFAKQNYTMLDNLKLGYGGTKSEMERLLEDAEKLKAAQGEVAEYSIDSYADVVEAIHVVQTEMGITGTTSKEAASTIEGSANSMKASWQNWLTAAADGEADLDAKTQELAENVCTYIENVVPVAITAIESIGKALGNIPDTLNKMAGKNTLGGEIDDMSDELVNLELSLVQANDLWDRIEGTWLEHTGFGVYLRDYIDYTHDAIIELEGFGNSVGGTFDAVAESGGMAAEAENEVAAAADNMAAATDKAAGSGEKLAAVTYEEWEAAQKAKEALLEISGSATEAMNGTGYLREAYNDLVSQFEKVDASVQPALAQMVEMQLAELNLAATNQELNASYPELVSRVSDFGYSVGDLSWWLIDNGVTAEEWGSQVMGTVDNIVNGFGKLDTDLDMSLTKMAENLRYNIDAYSSWRDNISYLMDEAVSRGDEGAIAFVQHMESMGVGAATQVQKMKDNMQWTFDTFAPMFGEAMDQGLGTAYDKIENSNVPGAVDGMTQEIMDSLTGMDIGDAGSQLPAQVAENITSNTEVVSTAVTTMATEAVGAFDDEDFTPSGTSAMEEVAAGISDASGTVEDAATAVAEAAQAAFDDVDFSPSGEAFDSEIAAGIEALAGEVGSAAEAAANDAAEQAKIDTSPVGEYFSDGLAAGIRAGRSGVIRAAIEVMKAAVQAAQDAGKIESPSKVMRDEVGVYLTEGIAAGMVDADALYALDEAADVVLDHIAGLFGVDLNGEDSDAIKAVKAWKDAWTGALDDTVRNTEHSIFLMEKNGKDYNEIIAAYRSLQKAVHEQAEQGRRMGLTENDKYIQELQKDWWDYEDKIQAMEKERADAEEKARKERQKAVEEALDSELKAMQDMADDLTDEYQSAFNDIAKAQEGMQSKLSGYGDLFHLTGTTVSLESLDSQTKMIERYGKTLESLRNRGVNGELLQEILGMDVKSATFYGEKLMEMTNREWENYMSSYQRKQDAAAKISEEFFAGDFEDLNSGYVQDVLEQMGDVFLQSLEQIPEGGELGDYMQQTLTEACEELLQELLAPILGGSLGDIVVDENGVRLAAAQGAAAENRASDQVSTMANALGELSRDIVNGIGGLMDTHMNVGESELSVTLGSEYELARILLPYLIATAKANGTPIVNE